MNLSEAQAVELLQSDDAFSIRIAAGVLRANIEDYRLDVTDGGVTRLPIDTNYAAFMSYASPHAIETANRADWNWDELAGSKAYRERAQYFEYWQRRLS